MNNNKTLVAVYGSLRKGMGNNRLLGTSILIGVDKISGYYMISLGGFPALIKSENKEHTDSVVEVYQVDDDTFNNLDVLEGYSEHSNHRFYDRELISTEFGDAWIYFQARPNEPSMNTINNLVKSGDWVEFCKSRYNSRIVSKKIDYV